MAKNNRLIIPSGYELLAQFTTLGQSYSFKNRQQIIYNKKMKRPMIIKSKEAKQFELEFQKQIPEEYKDKEFGALDQPLCLVTIVYYRSRRSDLSVEIVKDALEKSGVIKNDRYIREQHSLGVLDKNNPRIEIYLFKIDELTHLMTGEKDVFF